MCLHLPHESSVLLQYSANLKNACRVRFTYDRRESCRSWYHPAVKKKTKKSVVHGTLEDNIVDLTDLGVGFFFFCQRETMMYFKVMCNFFVTKEEWDESISLNSN